MIFGEHDQGTLEQFHDVSSRAVKAALMADGHRGYTMPIGGVAAYRNKVSVVGVGFDIACGNAAIETNLRLQDLCGVSLEQAKRNPARLKNNPNLVEMADTIFDTISFGIGRKNENDDAPVNHGLFEDGAWFLIPNTGGFRDELKEKARKQLGTVGGGNHYVDVFVDDKGKVWVGVHFGSRGFGHTIAKNFIAISQGGNWGDKAKEVEVLLDLDTYAGSDYWELMELAGKYAYVGREWVAEKVVDLIGAESTRLIHNHHNFAWEEGHDGEPLIVVRKGATPAWPGQYGFVGGSMGDESVILRGAANNSDIQKSALYSTVHGAGRVMGRRAAKGKWKKGQLVEHGLISRKMMNDWLNPTGVIVRGGDLDEAPQAYRRLPDVLAAQGDTIEVVTTLKPLIVCMAPGNTVDPYKD